MAHHSGRANLGAERGSSALRGNVDVMLSVQTTPAGTVTIKNTKQKDHPSFEDITVKLQPVSVGEGASSRVLVSPVCARGGPVVSRTRSENHQQALTALSQSGEDGLQAGDWRIAVGVARDCGLPGRTFSNWRRALLEQGLIEAVPGKRNHYRLTQAARATSE